MLGLSTAYQRGIEWALATLLMLNPPVWLDWTWNHAGEPNYLPMVFWMQDSAWNDIAVERAQEDGGLWLLGNEPEIPSFAVTPQEAVEFVVKWESEVGGEWAAPGIITWDNGYAWLEEYLALGGLVGDYWNIHIYFASTPDEWQAKWNEFKDWMIAKNLVRPVIVTETNGWGQDANQSAIIERIRVIQRTDPLLHIVIWYSDADYWETAQWTDLRNENGLTELGEYFVAIDKNPIVSRIFMPSISGTEK